MTDDKPTGTKVLVYTGQRWNSNTKKLSYRYIELPDGLKRNDGSELDDIPSNTWWYKKQLIVAAQPGQIYTVHVQTRDNGQFSIFVSGEFAPVYETIWLNEAQTDQWFLLNKTAYRQKQQHGAAAKEAKDKLPFKKLDSFRLAYSRASGDTRTLILAEIIQYITNPNKF